VKTNEQKEARMARTIRRSGLVAIALIAMVALAWLVAGCGTDGETTTSSTTTTVSGDSTTTTVADTTSVSQGDPRAQFEAELPALKQALEANPNDMESLQELAIVYYQLGNYQEAEATYKKMLAISNNALVRNNLGNVYRDWGKTDLAIATYEETIATDPTLKQPYVNLAGVYKAQGNIEKASEVLDQGLKYIDASEDKATLENAQKLLTSTTTT
jgi:Tfp pilus assembly protein PilF